MVDNNTGLNKDDIPTVLDYLFTNYVKVTSTKVKEVESEVINLQFNPSNPMIIVYRLIEHL